MLTTCGVFEPGFRGGGPVRSLALLVDTAPVDVDLTLVTRDRDVRAGAPYPGLSGRWIRRGRAEVFYLAVRDPRAWAALWRRVRGVRYDVLYVNSVWSPVFTVLPVLARRLGVLRARRVVVAPRGELSAGALSRKAWKKRPVLGPWGGVLRSLDVTWHASTGREAADIRRVYPWARVQVSLNQVPMPPEPLAPIPGRGPARFVFVSRIVPEKNLLLVIEALAGLPGDAELDIFGPVEDAGYWRRCRQAIEDGGLAARVRYRGELAPATVRDTFRHYDAFLFPTRGENFGHVIAESLSASCPVICSDRTSWTPVLRAGGGTVIPEPSPARLRAEIARVAARPAAERLAARRAAGAAYALWRAGTSNENFLATLAR
ncbi:hypothetical protein Asi03nite_13380 [Actinoplanes siamensis]|uniref:Glycosyl transferase family 1 domain-containing protein n=1 Tax=Actinoplanes siamensis TaxID=1223317 RepID=A0A919N3N8_9ACTN|nr:hypothetical protein Asi03nite_13380 [Actinoplanes siamensis]